MRFDKQFNSGFINQLNVMRLPSHSRRIPPPIACSSDLPVPGPPQQHTHASNRRRTRHPLPTGPRPHRSCTPRTGGWVAPSCGPAARRVAPSLPVGRRCPWTRPRAHRRRFAVRRSGSRTRRQIYAPWFFHLRILVL
jgi:hypothetical protein